ncbi:hypothetical protein N7463_008297, partial [Penicillium fimorum]
RTLTEELCTESNRTTVLKTTFGFPDDLAVEISIIERSSPKLEPPPPPRHCRIFLEYGTNFLWRVMEDIREDEQGTTESDEELVSFPTCVRELYTA